MTVQKTKVTLTDVPTLELKMLETWRLASAEETAMQCYQLNGVSVKKTGNRFAVESVFPASNRWDPEKENQRKTISKLLAELETARAEIAAQKEALDVAQGRLRDAERP